VCVCVCNDLVIYIACVCVCVCVVCVIGGGGLFTCMFVFVRRPCQVNHYDQNRTVVIFRFTVLNLATDLFQICILTNSINRLVR